MLQTNAQIQQGDSGGALANSAGQVIGMVTAANTGAAGQPSGTMGFAIPINTALGIARQIAGREGQLHGVHRAAGLPRRGRGAEQQPEPAAASRRRSGSRWRPRAGRQPAGPASASGQARAGVPAKIAPAASGALILGVVCGSAAQPRA